MNSFNNKSLVVFLLLISISMTWVVNWVYSKPDASFAHEIKSSFEKQEEDHQQHASEDFLDLDGMIEFLRTDDDRMVRFNVASEEAEYRQNEACSRDVERVMDLLIAGAKGRNESYEHEEQGGCTRPTDNIASSPPSATKNAAGHDDKVKAVKILTMCSLQNPYFRNIIGRYENGKVLDEIISMLDSKIVLGGGRGDAEEEEALLVASAGAAAAAVAAEAIWIFSFNNQYNHGYFVENGAIEKLSNIIKQESTFSQEEHKRSQNDVSRNSSMLLAAMWSAAALQNLAASYCETESGHCWWVFDHDSRRPKGLHLHPQSSLVIDGSTAATRISQDENLMVRVKDHVCRGTILGSGSTTTTSTTSPNTEIIPSLATIHEHHHLSSKITTWSMAGLLKNLALYESSKKAPTDVTSCLCVLTGSQDWLEASKATDALYRLGRDPDDDCHHSSHDRDL